MDTVSFRWYENSIHIIGHDMGHGNDYGKVLNVDTVDGMPVVVVVKWKGYTYNPGSRNSLIKEYVHPMTQVYEFVEVDKYGRRRYRLVTEWENKRKKKA